MSASNRSYSGGKSNISPTRKRNANSGDEEE